MIGLNDTNISISDIVMIVFFSILAQIPQAYLAYNAGVSVKDEMVIVVSIFLTIFGMSVIGTIIVNYLRGRMIEKHAVQAPLIASVITILTQYLIFIWCLSSLLNHLLFVNRFSDLFVFSQLFSVIVILILIAILTSQ